MSNHNTDRQEMLGGIIVLSILGSLVIGINIVIIRFFWWLGGVLFGG